MILMGVGDPKTNISDKVGAIEKIFALDPMN